MRKYQIVFCLIVLLIITGTSRSFALGIGGYMTLGGGDTQQKLKTNQEIMMLAPRQLLFSLPSHYRNLAVGGGLVLDTALASMDVFNFRLKVGCEQNRLDREKELKIVRLHLDTIFGFGLVRSRNVRWWLGPLLGGRYTIGNNVGYTASIEYYGGDAGIATGVNVNMGDHFTLGFELGFKYGLEWGSQKWNTLFKMIALSASMNRNLKLSGWEIYGSVSAMFRTGNDTNSRIRYTKTPE